MEGSQKVFPDSKMMVLKYSGGLFCDREEVQGRIQHRVSDEMDILGKAFPDKLINGSLGRAKEVRRAVVGEDAVVFLGHFRVEGTEASFDMGYRDV